MTKNSAQIKEWLAKAHILTEALPYMQLYAGKVVVVKYGGHSMTDNAATKQFAQDVVLLQQAGLQPVVVHGGGPQIETALKKQNIKSQFVNGLRVSDSKTLGVVAKALGALNKELVQLIHKVGGKAEGLASKTNSLITAKPTRAQLGFVGAPTALAKSKITALLRQKRIPVIAPLGTDKSGQLYNINADSVAGFIASALRAERFLLLTDVAGVLNKKGRLLSDLDVPDVKQLIANKTAQGGMIPKLETAIAAVGKGVPAAVIVDGRVPHAILLELFTGHGAGTLIRAKKKR